MRPDLNELFVFLAVADAGSFVAGGRATGLSRSAASKSVARLEERLGVRLIHRTTRTLHLTDEGRLFHEHARRIVAAIDDAEASMTGRIGTPRGLLRLTVPDAYGRCVILPLLHRFLATWPEVELEINFSDRRANLVDEGFDLAIRMGGTPGDTRLVSRRIARTGALLCASPAYLAARGEPASPNALADHDCLLYASDRRVQRWPLPGRDAQDGPPGRSRLRLDSGEALRDAAVAGFGIAWLPDFLVEPDLEAGRLRRVLSDVRFEAVDVVALYPTRRLLDPRVRRLIDFLVDALGD